MILSILDNTGSTSPGGDRRRYLQIGLLAFALLLVAILGFRQVQRMVTPQKEVWVASSDLAPGTTVGPTNVKRVKIAESALPKGALLDARAIAGRELSRPIPAGQPFVGGDFANAETQAVAVAQMVPEGRVLTTIRVPKGLVPYRNLKSGDRVDLVAVNAGRGGDGSVRVVARDAYLMGMIFSEQAARPAPRNSLAELVASSSTQSKGDPTLGLVLALHPEDALAVSQAYAQTQIQVVIHGSAEVASGNLLQLPDRGAAGVEFIAGSKVERLRVNQ